MKKLWGVHCDTETWFYGSEQQAIDQANRLRSFIHETSKVDGVWDGWDRPTIESVCVFRVIFSMQAVNPGAHYSQVDYQLTSLE
jgi:hypothetical protein